MYLSFSNLNEDEKMELLPETGISSFRDVSFTKLYINKNIESYKVNQLREGNKPFKKLSVPVPLIPKIINENVNNSPICYTPKGTIQ